MVSGAVAYQVLRAENPATIATVRAILEKHPWNDGRWKEKLSTVPDSQRDEMLFMIATTWADDIRTKDRAQHRGQWHYINFPFKPERQPGNVNTKPPEAVNILIAMAENERIAKTDSDPVRKAIAVTLALSSCWEMFTSRYILHSYSLPTTPIVTVEVIAYVFALKNRLRL
jgi:hypothetical protein